jgi:hypothetical protein
MNEREDAELWRRWRSEAARTDPDPMLLAAYAEGRATSEEVGLVERLLAAEPALAADLDLPVGGDDVSEAALARVVARAGGLVPPPTAVVVPFRSRQSGRLRLFGEWVAVAASFALVAWLGFALGTDVSSALDAGTQATEWHEVFDPPSGFFGNLVDQNAT